MIYCERCGVANREGSAYCNACAASLAAQDAVGEEPLPGWLRRAAVGTYLWRGSALLPEWLSTLRPFRELYGRDAVILPAPASAVAAAPHDEPPFEYPGDDEVVFGEIPDDEAGALESDVLVIDDEPEEEVPSREHESPVLLRAASDESVIRAEVGEYALPASPGDADEEAPIDLLRSYAPGAEVTSQPANSGPFVPEPPHPSVPPDGDAEPATTPASPQGGAVSRDEWEGEIDSAHTVEMDGERALRASTFVPAEPALEAPLEVHVGGWAAEEQSEARQSPEPPDREGVGDAHVAVDDLEGAQPSYRQLPTRDEGAVSEAAARLRADVEFVMDPRNESAAGERGGRR